VAVSDNIVVTPDVVALNLSAFAPTVTASDHIVVTPDKVDLLLTTFVPSIVVASPGVYIPDTLALALTTYAPVVTTTHNQPAPPVLVDGTSGHLYVYLGNGIIVRAD
jgi:hypothetical protein